MSLWVSAYELCQCVHVQIKEETETGNEYERGGRGGGGGGR